MNGDWIASSIFIQCIGIYIALLCLECKKNIPCTCSFIVKYTDQQFVTIQKKVAPRLHNFSKQLGHNDE